MMPKRKSGSPANLDKKLNRTLLVLSIVISVFIIVGFVGIALTTVQNAPPAPQQLDANVRIYVDGTYYTPETFKDAVVSGSITFTATITAGEPTAVWVDIYPEGDPQGTGSPLATKQMEKDSPQPGESSYDVWRTSYDTTQLENGIYWFFVRGSDGSNGGAAVALSVFGFERSEAGGSGEPAPFLIPFELLVTIIAVLGIAAFAVGAVILVRRR